MNYVIGLDKKPGANTVTYDLHRIGQQISQVQPRSRA